MRTYRTTITYDGLPHRFVHDFPTLLAALHYIGVNTVAGTRCTLVSRLT